MTSLWTTTKIIISNHYGLSLRPAYLPLLWCGLQRISLVRIQNLLLIIQGSIKYKSVIEATCQDHIKAQGRVKHQKSTTPINQNKKITLGTGVGGKCWEDYPTSRPRTVIEHLRNLPITWTSIWTLNGKGPCYFSMLITQIAKDLSVEVMLLLIKEILSSSLRNPWHRVRIWKT